MESDFYRQYQDLPIPELVKVARTPSDYLPEAVAAAQLILRERGVSEEVIAQEEWAIAQKEMEEGLKRGKMQDYGGWIAEFFGSEKLTNPSDRWFALLLVCYGAYYLYNMYLIIRRVVWVFRRTDNSSYVTGVFAVDLVVAFYISICLYFLFRQRWIAWSLLTIQVIYIFCEKFSFLFHLYAHHELFPERFWLIFYPVLPYLFFGILLWRPYAMATFKLTAAIKNRTLLVAAVLGLAAMLFS